MSILEGTVADMELKNEDIIYIPSRGGEKLDQTITIHGEVNYPGVYRFASNETIEAPVLQAGGADKCRLAGKGGCVETNHRSKCHSGQRTLPFTYSFSLNPDFYDSSGGESVCAAAIR